MSRVSTPAARPWRQGAWRALLSHEMLPKVQRPGPLAGRYIVWPWRRDLRCSQRSLMMTC